MDDPLQVGDAAVSPLAYMRGGEQPHADENVERTDVVVVSQRGLCGANHPFFQSPLSARGHSVFRSCPGIGFLRASLSRRWAFAFYMYSNERTELSVSPSGGFLGPPEEAFDVSARMYLS